MINISDILFRSIGFSVCAFFFLLSAIFILIYKMKKNVERRKLYNYMIIFTLAVIILEIIIPFTIQYKDVIPTLNEILCKIYLLFVFLWPAIFLIYLFSYKKEYLNKTFSIIVIICVCLCVLACLFIPFEYSTTTIYTIKGPLVVLMHLYCLSISFFEIIVLITKKIVVRNISYLPLIMGIILYTTLVLYQLISGNYFNIMSFMYTLIIIDLFYSAESQDYQLLEEYTNNKVQSELLNKNKDKFLSNMSNEIRTPMSNIIGLSDLIVMNNSNTIESIRNDGKKIYDESINLLSTINNILDLARFEANKEELNEINYHLDEFILDINKYIINKYNIVPIYKFSDNLPNNLYGDCSKLKKIIKLSIDSELKDGNVDNINIEYNCMELTSETISFNIVLTFIYKSSSSYIKKEELDLEDSIIELCSKLLNAKISKSILTDFKTEHRIDVSQSKTTNNKMENILEKIVSSSNNNYVDINDYSNKKTLIVDDSQININILKRLLAKYNISIDEALSGDACIELVSKNKYDIIFLDDMMPGLSGVETLKEMKTRYSSIPPVIALTANSYDGIKEKYLKDGFSNYLSKPINSLNIEEILSIYLSSGGGNNAL